MEHTYQGLIAGKWFIESLLKRLFPDQDLRDQLGRDQNGNMRYAHGAYGMNVINRLAPRGGSEAETYAQKLANAIGIE